jgi:Na+/proline symporter
MTTQTIITYVGLGLFTIILLFALVKIKDTIKMLSDIADDTLKKPDKKGVLKWSRTSLTMFTAWVVSIYMAMYDMYNHGFKYEVFLAFVGVALGSKIADGFSKKLDPTVGPTESKE